MKLIRWIVIGGVVLMLLPSDEEGQAALARKAVASAHYASTTCERHAEFCVKTREIWSSLKKKAEFAGRVAWDVVFDRKSAEAQAPTVATAPQPPSQSTLPTPKRDTRLLDGTPKRETPKVETGTLRTSDRAVPWQGQERVR